MTDLDVQVYKELLNAEYEKLKSIHPVTGCAAVRKTGWDSDCNPAFRAG